MKIVDRTPLALAALGMAVPLALAGCEMREEPDQEPAPASSEETIGTPAPEETRPPVASIIRDDSLPGPIMELPPQPLRLTVPYAEGGSDLSSRAEQVLAGVLQSDALDEDWPIILRGHTDSAGNDQANIRASRARAEAVAAWLVERGVDDERINVIAMGEQNPLAPNARPDGEPNEAGRARNRRVDIEIAPAPAPRLDGEAVEGATIRNETVEEDETA